MQVRILPLPQTQTNKTMKKLIFTILDVAILMQMVYYIICVISGNVKFIFWIVINCLLFIVCTLSLIEEFKKSKSNEKSN